MWNHRKNHEPHNLELKRRRCYFCEKGKNSNVSGTVSSRPENHSPLCELQKTNLKINLKI